jgi:RimJ/RimL family protein N-acetyltransferase
MELRWQREGVLYRAIEPSHALLTEHGDTLRDWYNLPQNAAMMGNTVEMSRDEVIEYWSTVADRAARGFLLFVDDALAGDAELRNITSDRAEFSLMIGALAEQGRGLGATFAAMLHVFAFRVLGIERVYVQPKPENVRVQRMELRLGYAIDNSPEARALVDDERDITMSITRDVFAEHNADAWHNVQSLYET